MKTKTTLLALAWLAALSTAGLLGVAPLARAQSASGGADVTAKEQALTHFKRGVELYNEANYDAALVEFLEAYRIAPNYRIRYNIGQIRFQLKEYSEAIKEFRRYLDEGGTELSPERRTEVSQAIASLQTRISSISVETNVPGARVQVDGVDMGKTPLEPITVNIGRHRVVVHLEGYQSQEKIAQVTSDSSETLKFDLQRIRVDSQGRPIIITQGPKTPWVAIIAGSLTLGGAAMAGIFGGLALTANSDLTKTLGTYPGDPTLVDTYRKQVKDRALVADISGGIAIAAGVVTIIALVAGGGGKEDKATKDDGAKPKEKPTALHVGPTGLLFDYRF